MSTSGDENENLKACIQPPHATLTAITGAKPSSDTLASRLEATNAAKYIQDPSSFFNNIKGPSTANPMKHVCSQCGKSFGLERNLLQHCKNVHNIDSLVDNKGRCKCLECGQRFRRVDSFRTHLQTNHQMKFNTETKHFPHYSDFKQWLSAYEKETVSNFIKSSGEKKLKGGTPSEYWLCSRSGISQSNYNEANQHERMRKQREIRTIKLDMNCTSSIKVTQNILFDDTSKSTLTSTSSVTSEPATSTSSGKNKLPPMHMSAVSVLICHTHYGHECDKEYTWHKVPKKKRRTSGKKQLDVDALKDAGEIKQHINNQLLMIAQHVKQVAQQVECSDSNKSALKSLYKELTASFRTFDVSVNSLIIDTLPTSKRIQVEQPSDTANKHLSNNMIFN